MSIQKHANECSYQLYLLQDKDGVTLKFYQPMNGLKMYGISIQWDATQIFKNELLVQQLNG